MTDDALIPPSGVRQSAFSLESQRRAIAQELLANPPSSAGRGRLLVRCTFPDGTVSVGYVRKTEHGAIEFDVAAHVLRDPGVSIGFDWEF